MLKGAIAAAVTPLGDGGERLDEDAFAPMVRFLADGGLDGLLAMGTTGEGILLSPDERRRGAELFVQTAPHGFAIAVHAGAQTTRETVALARHAAEVGAAAVAVIAPPYFVFDERELLFHYLAAADACAPLDFYVYEFAARSGYPIPLSVISELRERASNLRGLKVSDRPFDKARPYLLDGLDVFMGAEPLTLEGMRHGAIGAVSGLAAAWPEVVASLVHDRSEDAHRRVSALREGFSGIPFQAGLKVVLGERGVPIRPDVRAPLRALDEEERRAVVALVG